MLFLSFGLFLIVSQCWNNRKISRIGSIITESSFAIYLVHQLIINLLLKYGLFIDADMLFNVCFIFIVAFVSSILINKLFTYVKQLI